MNDPAGVYDAWQLAEATARGPFIREFEEARRRLADLLFVLDEYDTDQCDWEDTMEERRKARGWLEAELRPAKENNG